MAIDFKGLLSNPMAAYQSAKQPGGLLAPVTSMNQFLGDPRVNIGLAIAQGQPIGKAVLGGYKQAIELQDMFSKQNVKKKLASGEKLSEADLASYAPETFLTYKMKEEFTKQDPYSQIGKINADYLNGNITQPQYEKAIKEYTGDKQFAPGEMEKYVNYAKKVFTDKTDVELANEFISWKTTEKAPTREEWMSKAYTATLNTITGNTDKAAEAAISAGKFWDKNLITNNSAKFTMEDLQQAELNGYTNITYENGKVLATNKDGQRGELILDNSNLD